MDAEDETDHCRNFRDIHRGRRFRTIRGDNSQSYGRVLHKAHFLQLRLSVRGFYLVAMVCPSVLLSIGDYDYRQVCFIVMEGS